MLFKPAQRGFLSIPLDLESAEKQRFCVELKEHSVFWVLEKTSFSVKRDNTFKVPIGA